MHITLVFDKALVHQTVDLFQVSNNVFHKYPYTFFIYVKKKLSIIINRNW